MNEEQLERVKHYFGKGDYLYLKVDGDEQPAKFLIKPVSLPRLGKMIYIIGRMQAVDDDVMKLSEDETNIMLELMMESISRSPDFDGLTDEQKQDFVACNYIAMIPAFFKVNALGVNHIADENVINRIKKIREARAANEPATNKGPHAEAAA